MSRKNNKNSSLQESINKEELNKELKRNIVIGAILRNIHRQQGTMPYLIQVVEPYLKKADRSVLQQAEGRNSIS